MRTTFVAVIVAALVALAAGGCSDDEGQTGAGANLELSALPVGETVDGDGMTATVHAVDTDYTRGRHLGDGPDDRFIAVDAEICADENGPQLSETTGVMFWLVMDDNTRGDVEPVGAKEPAWPWAPLNPGSCMRGWITYQAGTDVEPVAVESDLARWELG